ncbi:hypothetical protein ACPJHQ_21060 [Rossellomorea sp. H39__3]
MSTIIDVFLHLDQHIAGYMNEYGVWIYVILFAIIFCETGLVVLPFLPGTPCFSLQAPLQHPGRFTCCRSS